MVAEGLPIRQRRRIDRVCIARACAREAIASRRRA
jgi:hypothetical protein